MINIRSKSGFTLIELMIVVAISTILTSISFSAYRMFANRARAHEAVNVMAIIRTAQISHKSINDVYLALEAHPSEIPSDYVQWGDPEENWHKLGIDIMRRVRYQYVGEAGNTNNIATSFRITAQSDFDRQGEPYDTWTLANNEPLIHTNQYK